MKTLRLIVLIIVLACVSGFNFPTEKILSTDEVANMIISKVQSLNLYDFENLQFKKRGTIPSCRDEFRYALCLLSSDNQKNHAQGNFILQKYLVSQVRDDESKYYGSWFYPEYLETKDGLEWDMFIPQTVIQIWFEQNDRLSKKTKQILLESLVYTVDGLKKTWFQNYRSTTAHTNYHLMYISDLLLCSEIIGNSIGSDFAKIVFDDFVNWTLENGLTEFNSPTYLATDLQALYLIKKHSVDESMQALSKNWADFLIADIMIHYLSEKEWMAGANSRCYEVKSGSGGTVSEIRRLLQGGLSKEMVGSVGTISTVYFDYKIPEWILKLSKELDNNFVFKSKWLDNPWATRQTWFGEHVVLGSSGMSYGSQDRNVVLDLSRDDRHSSQFVPIISVNNKPWELPNIGGGSGHNHPKIPVFTNQDKNKLIQLSHIRFNYPVSSEVFRIALSFVCPNNVSINDTAGKTFVVKNPKMSAFVKPFFILPKNMDVNFNIKPSNKFDGCVIDYEFMEYDAGIIQVGDLFVGFVMEIFEGEEREKTISEWSTNLDFVLEKRSEFIYCRFDDLVIDYSMKNRFPQNTPKIFMDSILDTPLTCVSDGYFYVYDKKIPLTRKLLQYE